MNKFARKAKKFLRENLFPVNYTCYLCGVEVFKDGLCPLCTEEVTLNNGATCPVCGRKTAKNEICIECKALRPSFDRAVSATVYGDGTVRLIGQMKKGMPYVAEYFAPLIAEKIRNLPASDGIVCVPITKETLKKRGYNQAEKLAEKVSAVTGIPVLYGAAVKTKQTPEQKGLSRAERAKNLVGCFKIDKKLVKGKTLLVIDDVLTTGATLDALCKKLKSAGTCAVFAATAASVEYSQEGRV